MTDLVERLRGEHGVDAMIASCSPAADALEQWQRLAEETFKEAKMHFDTAERLRAALEKIAQCKDDVPHSPAAFINAIAEEGTKDEAIGYLHKEWNVRTYLQHIARAALGGEEGK